MMSGEQITLVNPLPTMLAHYEREMVETLARVGFSSAIVNDRPAEGLSGLSGKLRMIGNGLSNASRGRSSSPAIQLWPTFGLYESLLWNGRRGAARNAIIIHDPVPIRKQYGFGQLAHLYALKSVGRDRSALLIAHSEKAAGTLESLFPRREVALAFHPVLSATARSHPNSTRSVLVAGQYKPERDLELIRALGPLLEAAGFGGRIVGRGWPTDLEGWAVTDSFVPEDVLENEIRDASVLLLPYKNYFQSGIALRAQELGTRVLGEATDFLEAITQGDERSLYPRGASADDVASRILQLADHSDDGCEASLEAYRVQVDAQWSDVLARIS